MLAEKAQIMDSIYQKIMDREKIKLYNLYVYKKMYTNTNT